MSYAENDKSQCIQCSLATFCAYSEKHGIETKRRVIKPKETLQFAHDKFTNLYVIESGALKTHETDLMGNEFIRGLYLKHEVYGYEAIYKGQYPFSSDALTKTIVCEISYQHFLTLLHSEPAFLGRVLYLLSQQLTARYYLNRLSAQQKLSAFILDLSARLLTKEPHLDFLLPISYRDIGSYLGLATETVSRVFSKLSKNNIISIQNKHIYLLDSHRLRLLAEGAMP